MANAILAFPNQVDATFYTVAFSNGSWEASLPLTNLRDPLISSVARSTDATLASTKFDVDLGITRNIRVAGIPAHSMSRAARVKITAATDAGFTNIVTTIDWFDVWRVIYPWGTLTWEDPSWWDGKITEEQAEGYPMPVVHVFTTAVTARYWRFEIDDTGNADGYVDIARLFLASGYQPTYNIPVGASLGWETDTSVERSLGGAEFYDERQVRRATQFVLDVIPNDESLSGPFEMTRQLGISKQLLFVMDPDDTANLHRRTFLATMRRLSPLEMPYVEMNQMAFELQEVIA